MWKLESETPMHNNGVYQIWRNGDEVMYRLVAPYDPPGSRPTARDVLNELQKANSDE